jgi:hypothetical protein
MQRSLLVAGMTILALVAVATAQLPSGIATVSALAVLFAGGRAAIAFRGRLHLDRIEDGRLRVQTPAGETLHGTLQTHYCSRFFCAFAVDDPAAGIRVFGLFQDEVDPERWRRLRVALRSGSQR